MPPALACFLPRPLIHRVIGSWFVLNAPGCARREQPPLIEEFGVGPLGRGINPVKLVRSPRYPRPQARPLIRDHQLHLDRQCFRLCLPDYRRRDEAGEHLPDQRFANRLHSSMANGSRPRESPREATRLQTRGPSPVRGGSQTRRRTRHPRMGLALPREEIPKGCGCEAQHDNPVTISQAMPRCPLGSWLRGHGTLERAAG
jgi:hypothetical protein